MVCHPKFETSIASLKYKTAITVDSFRNLWASRERKIQQLQTSDRQYYRLVYILPFTSHALIWLGKKIVLSVFEIRYTSLRKVFPLLLMASLYACPLKSSVIYVGLCDFKSCLHLLQINPIKPIKFSWEHFFIDDMFLKQLTTLKKIMFSPEEVTLWVD